MHFSVKQWSDAHPEAPFCPYRVLDPANGCMIEGVTEFDDDAGWLRVLVRNRIDPDYSGEWARVLPEDVLVTQIVRMPFQIVPYYEGIDDLPKTHVDTLELQDGRPVGDWVPAGDPFSPSD